MKILFTAFKGVHNTSFQLVNQTENIFFGGLDKERHKFVSV